MASSSSGGYVSRYDVFLSFRGEDTRDSFTDHLYQALRRAGIYTFRDDDAIPRGEDLKPEIKRGIRESRASIIVLSELYATSRWCLDELYLILKQRKTCNHFVLPIFYHVDPSHVRKREGTFKIEAKAGTKWTEDKVKEWNKALRKVGNMTGEVVCGPETDFIIDIVGSIKEKLDLKHVYRQGNLVGMETRDKEINYWLEQLDCEIIAISGIGGCGKTTLARHIAYSNWHKFEGVSILEDIGSRSTEELCQLKERLISDIIQGKEKTIPSVWQGTYTIKNALQRKKVLIVLDNIVTKKQVVDLLGTGTKTHSKFILTTREKDPSTWFESHPWRCRVHTMKLLDHDDSLKLLNLHAFKPNAPKEDYHEELAQTVLEYCQGNPLALEVLGSSLNRDSRKQFWKSILNSLVREVPGEIQSVLLTSYDSLHLESEKELFLHIACFFIGKDKDSVEKILEPDYSAISGIVTLINSSLLFVSPDNKLMMHRLLQEMAKTIVLKESPRRPGDRSRICHDIESYDVLVNKKGTKMVEGLALNMELLNQEHVNGQLPGIHELVSHVDTNSFERMNNLKLLLLNQLELTGSYTYFSQDLRLLRLRGFHLQAIPSELYMGKLVAIDMSCSKLKLFQPPYVLPLLKILDLRGSDDLTEICNISLVPNLETLILWSCRKLVRVCDTLGDHKRVTLLNITGCENLCKREQPNAFKRIQLSLFGGRSTYRPCFRLPISLKRLFAKDTNLEDTDYFPLTFEDQPCLEYINLVNSPFENLPDYTHLKNLLVLDLSFCRKLKTLLNLPCRLAELYTFYCISLERVTFESHKYTLQEFRYEGCVNLSEVEDFFKIVPVATLTGADLGHMNWLRAYQDLEMCLVGDDDLTKGRTLCLQMLYEFSIMSISLPDIEKPNMIPENEYTSEDPILSFDIPESHRNRKLRGLNLTFKYTLQGDEWVWFAIIRTNNGVDLIYNPKVFGKPAADEVGIWLSYWPIGESLHVGDEVNVSIIVTKGLEINECGARLVYAGEEDEDESFEDSNKSIVEDHESFEDAKDFFEDNNEHADILGGDIFRFKLSTGTYYLCRRDYCQLMEVGRLTPNWFRDLVGDTIDYTEIGGWRKTGRPDQPYRSYTKLKTVGSIIYGPHLEELYKIEELSKSCLSDKTEEYTSEFSKDATKDKHESANLETKNQSKAFDSDEVRQSTSSTHGDSAATKAIATAEIRGEYPERAGQPECQYYMKTGTCKFGETCKFHHPRDKAGIAGRVSLNVLGYPLRTNEAECAFYMRTGQCKYGSTCKFHHPQPSNMMISYLGSPAYPTVQSPTSPGQQSFPGGITNLPLSRARFISPRWQAPSNYAPMILPHSAVSGGSAYGKNKQEELYKIEELSKSSLSDKTEEYTSESSKVLTKFPHLKIELEAIKSATNEFDDAHCIGKGGFGKVYKGELVLSRGRSVVAIKRLDRAFGQGNPEFFREIIVRSLYKHDNIVSLLGFCDDYGEMILIYEYASKGSLDLYLNDKDLKWVQRLKICIGAARGLAYLHNPGRSQQRVLHRDIKSSNILIDDNWNARIADLGLSEFGPANQKYTSLVSNAVGTIGYYDPIYIQTGLQTKESDVYSFGVVLFEVLCGKLCIDNNQDERQPLTKLVHESYKQNTIDEIIYGNIKDEINPHSLKVFTTIALECLKREREQRPSITQVVERLERALRLQVSNVSTPPSLTPAEPSASPNKSPFSSSMSIQQSSHSESDEVKIEELEEEYMEHLERGNEARRKKT